MLSQREEQSFEATALPHVTSMSKDDLSVDTSVSNNPASHFYSQFADCMEMYADTATVSKYFETHQVWFCRCAQPMKVEPLGENGYVLAIGRFGAFGYEVEPKVGLEMSPSSHDVYSINTISVPNYQTSGYEVDFKAAMKLVEASVPNHAYPEVTHVKWQLDLTVDIQFPKFIHRLPKSLVQNTGDRLLNQIIKQVSRRLTYKVQEDFHKSLNIPFPPKSKQRE